MKKMKSESLKVFSLLMFFTLLTASCTIVKPVKVGAVKTLKVNEFSFKKINLEVLLPIKNPNWVNFKITDIDLDVSLNNIKLGKINNGKEFNIKANSDEVHNFEIDVKLSNLLVGAFSLINSLQKNEIELNVVGYIKGKSLIFTKKVKINQTRNVKLVKE